MIREICKAGWLQQKVVKRSNAAVWSKHSKTIFLPEKWYVLCVHDDRYPCLEVYPSDEAVSRHEPSETNNLNECQYITTAIEDDRTFVIAFQDRGRSSLELAALSALERREWMDMLRFKLTRLGCLESGSNIYSPLPLSAAPALNSGEAISENSMVNSFSPSPTADESVEHIYEPTRREVITANASAEDVMAPITRSQNDDAIYEPIARVSRPESDIPPVAIGASTEDNHSSPDETQTPMQPAGYSVINKEVKPVLPPRNGHLGATWSTTNATLEVSHRRRSSHSDAESSTTLYDIPRALLPPLGLPAASSANPCAAANKSNIEKYDPLPLERESSVLSEQEENAIAAPLTASDSDSQNNAASLTSTPRGEEECANGLVSFSFDNLGFAEDDDSLRHYANGPLAPATPSQHARDDSRGPYSALPGRTRMVPWSAATVKGTSSSSPANETRASSSSPMTHPEIPPRYRSQSVTTVDYANTANLLTNGRAERQSSDTPSPPTSPPPAPPLPLPNSLSMQVASGRAMPLKVTEVERLRSEMDSPLHVKVQLLLQYVINEHGQPMGLALVDMMGFVWIAGWMRLMTKRFATAVHIGDRLDSILDADGKAVPVNSTAKVEQVLRDLWKNKCTQVSLLLKRLPLGEVYILKRAISGDNVGIVLKAGKNEILAIEEDKAARKAGMRAQCKSTQDGGNHMVNFFITEVNGRPVNIFAKDHEAQRRLGAVGFEITVLVQPSDFMKELKKKLKRRRGYKDYVVG